MATVVSALRSSMRSTSSRNNKVTFSEQTFSLPKTLSVYHFVGDLNQKWVVAQRRPLSDHPSHAPPSEFQLITWNIDARSDHLKRRCKNGLKYLEKNIFGNIPPPPCCILLQEVHQDILPVLLKSDWIRQQFLVTPIHADDWVATYGVVTLISKQIPVSTVFSIDLPKTTVGHQALFVDLLLSAPPPTREVQIADRRIRVIRIANTHLEPRLFDERVRRKQLRGIARLLYVENLEASICAGSMCSFRDRENMGPIQAGLVDACKGPPDRSTTWGHHPLTMRRPLRLDKILYVPTEKVEIGDSTRIAHRAHMKSGSYFSDHCALSAMVKIRREH